MYTQCMQTYTIKKMSLSHKQVFYTIIARKHFPGLLLLVLITHPLDAQNQIDWKEDLFFTLSGQYYIFPDMADRYGVSAGIIAIPGFRAGAGYEWQRWNFALESGFTYIKGDNPLVLNIKFVPLFLKAGYSFYPLPQYQHFSLTPTLAFGTIFTWVDHYKDVIDMLTDRLTQSRNSGLLIQLGVRAGIVPFSSLERKLEVFAGLSLDAVIETKGLIPLPQLELGIIFRPFARNRAAEDPPPSELVFAHIPENIIIEETDQGRTVRLLNAVYFLADSAQIIERYRPILDEAGRRLQANPQFQITLRGYTAPFGTPEGRAVLSESRARFCRDYFMQNFGIEEERISIEFYGADRAPEFSDASWESFRCVELIIVE